MSSFCAFDEIAISINQKSLYRDVGRDGEIGGRQTPPGARPGGAKFGFKKGQISVADRLYFLDTDIVNIRVS